MTIAAPANRWLIAIMGTLLQLCLGTVYAWSFFQKPLMAAYGWSNAQVSLAFSLAICFLGLAAAWGGINLGKYGPRRLAMIGGVLFGSGYFLAAAALHFASLPLLYVGYGVIGGIGLGLGYVTPVATAAKWFPDKKGLITGMVIMGFGFGALLMSKILAPTLVQLTSSNYVLVFTYLGIIFLIAAVTAGSFLQNPPAGFAPRSCASCKPAAKANAVSDLAHSSGRCLWSGRFITMWLVFFCNIAAGIAIIGFQSPLMQDAWKKLDPSLSPAALASYGATLIAVSSIFNGLGRFFWGALSDRIGRVQVFRIMLGTQVLVLVALVFVSNPWLLGLMICYVLLCYGGGFGTMPSFVMDVFGARKMPVVYGVVLTAWSAAGVVGPQLFALVKDHSPLEKAPLYCFAISAGFLAMGLVCSVAFLSNSPFRCRRNPAVTPACGAPCLAAEPTQV